MDSRPQRMFRNGRGEDQVFENHHSLFRRCNKDDIVDDRWFPARISYQNMSTNWSKYSEPEDVVFGYIGYGILSIPVSILPHNLEPDGLGHPWSFKPVHEPLEDNYSHTVIAGFKNDVRSNSPKPSEIIKKKYRQIISDKTQILRYPTA